MSPQPRRGFPIVVAAPSGTGKTTVCCGVVQRDPGIEFSVSHTTRPPRATDTASDFVNYHHVDRGEFQRLVKEEVFLEWAEYNGNYYGTSWAALEAPLAAGRDVLLEIEVQGARQVRARRADARFIFLLPPSWKALEERLRGRGSDSREQIRARLALARQEIVSARDFDYAVVNDVFEHCVERVLEIIRAERAGDPGELRRRFDPGDALERFEGGLDG
ncbi:MAG: guanylate kinase [Myxococcota bacterium]